MRQPKFKLGDRVNFSTEVKFVKTPSIKEKVIREGTISAVYYDPMCYEDGSPYFVYSVFYEKVSISGFKEKDLGRAKDEWE